MSNSDSSNGNLKLLVNQAAPPILFLDHDLRLREFTASAGTVFNLSSANIGSTTGELAAALGIASLETVVAAVAEGSVVEERDVSSKRSRWYSMRVTPIASDGRLGGVAVTLIDVTKTKAEALNALAYAEAMGESARGAVVVLDAQLVARAANRAFFEIFRTTPETTLGRPIQEIGEGAWDIPRVVGLLREVIAQPREFKEFHLEHDFPAIGRRRIQLYLSRAQLSEPPYSLILTIIEDAAQSMQSSEARLRALVRSIDDIVFEVDEHGRCLSAWTGNAELFSRQKKQPGNRSIEDFLPSASSPDFANALQRVMETQKPENLEYSLELDERKRWFLARINRISSQGPGKPTFSALVREITARKEAEIALIQSEERFRLLVEGVKDYAIYALDTEGRVVSWNSGATRIKGYEREEILGKHFSVFYEPEDIAAGKPQRDLEIAAAEGRQEDTGWRVRKDASRFYANLLITAIRDKDGTLLGFTKVTRDITDQRKAEQAVRRLSGHILRLQDQERRRIARELHDSTAQLLTALTMNLTLAAKTSEVSRTGQASKLIAECELFAKQAADEIRNVSHLLHPPDLDAVGLVAAIRWYVARFEQRSGITVKINMPHDLCRLPLDSETALFRVVQESLTNVQRHSGSKTALIRLAQRDHVVELDIEDRGRGIASDVLGPKVPAAEHLGIGIAGMRERLKQLSGSLEIISTSRGTKVKAVVPCPPEAPHGCASLLS